MTEAEALESIAVYGSVALESYTLYLSFVFAYIATAYFAGKNLSRFQVLAASGLFLLATMSVVLSTMGGVQAWAEIKRSNPTVIDNAPFYSPEIYLVMMPAIMIPGVLVSLYFMWNVRHSEA